MRKKITAFLSDYPHVWTVLYFPLYLAAFLYLEGMDARPYHIIHFPLDQMIPFCEYFIIPYFLWFIYIAAVFLRLFFRDRSGFYRYAVFLYTGMTVFLIASAVYPNGHLLRPAGFDRDNIFIRMVCFLYQTDTSTNILPSIHVFNSIAAHMAVVHTPELSKNRWTVRGSRILAVSIVLSTVFLKQHSCIDVFAGILAALFMNELVYRSDILIKAHHLVGKLIGKNRYLSPAFSGKIHGTAEDAEI